MKELFMALIALASVSYASAQATEVKGTQIADTTIAATDVADQRTPVKLEDLPEAVKKALASEPYTGWTPTSAFWIEGKVSYYEIELSKGDDKSTLKFDKAGQLVK